LVELFRVLEAPPLAPSPIAGNIVAARHQQHPREAAGTRSREQDAAADRVCPRELVDQI
jgi:hypothetical protein